MEYSYSGFIRKGISGLFNKVSSEVIQNMVLNYSLLHDFFLKWLESEKTLDYRFKLRGFNKWFKLFEQRFQITYNIVYFWGKWGKSCLDEQPRILPNLVPDKFPIFVTGYFRNWSVHGPPTFTDPSRSSIHILLFRFVKSLKIPHLSKNRSFPFQKSIHKEIIKLDKLLFKLHFSFFK